jgi:hypothetical protein
MDFVQNHCHGVFELPLPRNAKRPKTYNVLKQKQKGGKIGWWVGGSGI